MFKYLLIVCKGWLQAQIAQPRIKLILLCYNDETPLAYHFSYIMTSYKVIHRIVLYLFTISGACGSHMFVKGSLF